MPLDLLTHLFGKEDSLLIQRLAKKVNALEAQWKRKYKKHIEELTDTILNNAQKTGRLNVSDVDFEELIMKHRLDVVQSATKHAKSTPAKSSLAGPTGVSKKKAQKMSLLEIVRRQYDTWKKTGKLPRDSKIIADGMKKTYIEKLKTAYKEFGEEFRSGKKYEQDEARIKIQEAANVSYARAKTIVNTETTRYYNQARLDFYDDAEGVTHYLFMAIRDSRTTKWCKTRHRLVYKKDSLILDKETPPCHWNCRSEIIPLTPSNPRHKSYIQDKGSLRENNSPEPLPKGWKK